ncbi:MAG: cobalamin-dependent protein, partial [SAR324 cluster bacterium]|nr:cobalamin-dependent protein [SAR324 cluster bacterium]
MNSPHRTKTISLQNKVRIVTATSLFDGHDAAINIMRRIIQSQGAEVIHLGHDRGVEEIVDVAIQEDVQGIAVSSYQGGHNEYFRYMVDLLKKKESGHIQVFAGGGGVIVPSEIDELMEYGVNRVYSPEDGRELGLQGMIADMLKRTDFPLLTVDFKPEPEKLIPGSIQHIARSLTWAEGSLTDEQNPVHQQVVTNFLDELPDNSHIPVIGLTGTGGAGKSCLMDELVRSFITEFQDKRVAIVSIDPSKRKTGGALLGDRLRMNSIHDQRVYMRSLATRRSHLATSASLDSSVKLLRASGFDLILVETAGIGQSDSEISDLVDFSIYVMTPEYGAETQLEKINMIDFADCIVINKFDKPGAEDALRAVRKQYCRSHLDFDAHPESLPVFGVVANRFNDVGTKWFYYKLIELLIQTKGLNWKRSQKADFAVSEISELIPAERKEYLRQISSTVRSYKNQVREHAVITSECGQLHGTVQQMSGLKIGIAEKIPDQGNEKSETIAVQELYNEKLKKLPESLLKQLNEFENNRQEYLKDNFSFTVRENTKEIENYRTS